MNKIVMWIAIVIVVVGGGYWIYSKIQTPVSEESVLMEEVQQEEVNENNSVPSENEQVNNEESPAVPPQAVVKTFTVAGTSDFKFSLSEMRVKKGDRVTIVFTNVSGVHDWKVDEFKAATRVLKAGESETISFVADKTGSFEYYCSVGNHRAMGMKGMLIVE